MSHAHTVSLKDQLNSKFGIKNSVHFTEGHGGLLKVTLQHENGSTVECYLYGAHIVSWKDSTGKDLLFVSKNSFFAHGKPIRGGVPVIFPQFGPGELPQHGFARISTGWQVESTRLDDNKNVTVILSLTENDDSLKIWPHHFSLKFLVSLAPNALHNELTVDNTNKDDKDFTFTTGLHTYYHIGSIHDLTIRGLKGIRYIDKVDQMQVKEETADDKKITSENDAVYINAPDSVVIRDAKNGVTFNVQKKGFTDVVVWNPWIEKAKKIADFVPEEYVNMVCVEAAVVNTPIQLKPGAKWVGHLMSEVTH